MSKRFPRLLALILLAQALVSVLPAARAETSAALANKLEIHSGMTSVSWSVAGEECPPYRILFRLLESGTAKQALYTAGETDLHSLVTADLLPGKKYQLYLTANGGKVLDTKVFTMPAQPKFTSGKLTHSSVRVECAPVTLEFGGDRTKDTKKVRSLSADDIKYCLNAENTGTCGCKYTIRFPRQKDFVPLLVTISFESPDGFITTVIADEFAFDRISNGTQNLSFYLIGFSFFSDLYAVNGQIPAGSYAIHLYLNGMWTNTSHFNVI